MKNKLLIFTGMIALLLGVYGCKKNELDPLAVVTRYYAAVEKGDANQAYQYLCDRSYISIGPDGQQMKFRARPDQASYIGLMSVAPKITVESIEEQPQLSTPDKVIIFKITASVKEQERNVYNSAAQFYAYLGQNSEKQWSVMLPDLGNNISTKEEPDTASVSP